MEESFFNVCLILFSISIVIFAFAWMFCKVLFKLLPGLSPDNEDEQETIIVYVKNGVRDR